ncbi:MAG: hypothetical protein J0L55_13150 [Caulobacterales bacterium]|nr:hypothetical protein [Caulobacterales bacterium]
MENNLSFLSEDEIGSLRLTGMILHVVGDQEFSPEHERIIEHEEFFIDRIKNTDVSPIFKFNADSQTKSRIESISNGAITFEQGAQELARDFSRLHVAASRDGAFFIFEMSCNEQNTKIYSFVKYDYSEAIEQSSTEEGSLLRRIVTAFIADKKAIQKATLIRTVNGVAQDAVSALDRAKQAPDIVDYFAKFFGVERNRDNQELNRNTLEVVRHVIVSEKDNFPNCDAASAVRQAQGYLRDCQIINNQTISDSIMLALGNPDNEADRTRVNRKTERRIASNRLSGLSFAPDRNILRLPLTRKVKTIEGVIISYPNDEGGTLVSRTPREEGGETITITTSLITEDSVVSNKSR